MPNTQLKQQVVELTREIDVLLELGEQVVTELDPQVLLPRVARLAREVIGAQTLLVPMIHDESGEYEYAAGDGLNAERIIGHRFPVGTGMCGWVLQNRRPMLFGEGYPMPMDPATKWEPGMDSALLVPLIARGRIIGGLSGTGKEDGGSFSRRDLDLLTLFANQTSVALDNARIVSQLRGQRTQLELLVDELTYQKNHAEVTLEALADGVITTDLSGRVISINAVGRILLGCSEDGIVGRAVTDVTALYLEDGESVEHPVTSALAYDCMVRMSERVTLQTPVSRTFPAELSAAVLRNAELESVGTVLVFRDVSEQRRLNETLRYQASHDALTDLVNRSEFEKRLGQALAVAADGSCEHALLYIDIDRFKVINDSCGHKAGDEVLRKVSACLSDPLRGSDVLARLGGDEFAVLLYDCPLNKARSIAGSLCASVAACSFSWAGTLYNSSVSIGVAPVTRSAGDITALLSAADMACYAAKEAGRNRVHVVHEGDDVVARRRGELSWLARLRTALNTDGFALYYQKICSSEDAGNLCSHVEILLRLVDGEGMIGPGVFIPAAERYGLMPDIDRWVVRQVFVRGAELIAAQGLPADTVCSINLSGASLSDERLVSFILEQQIESGLVPKNICFEVTETAAIQNLSVATDLMGELRSYGYRFALDDFGSGLSSFAYLKNLPVDYLKIDGSFVRNMVDDPIDRAMVRSISEIGKAMGIRTVAEFVENRQILEALAEIDVDLAQGYHLHQPEPF